MHTRRDLAGRTDTLSSGNRRRVVLRSSSSPSAWSAGVDMVMNSMAMIRVSGILARPCDSLTPNLDLSQRVHQVLGWQAGWRLTSAAPGCDTLVIAASVVFRQDQQARHHRRQISDGCCLHGALGLLRGLHMQ